VWWPYLHASRFCINSKACSNAKNTEQELEHVHQVSY
jgi:hypothetical protein